jgi:hypothetical protein
MSTHALRTAGPLVDQPAGTREIILRYAAAACARPHGVADLDAARVGGTHPGAASYGKWRQLSLHSPVN